MRNYGASLFDLNVRAKLRGSSVNDGIRRTISNPSGQRAFVHLNNGIVITCSNYKFSSEHLQITLNGAQVVNGCQTLSTIWDYYLSANDAQKADLCSNLKILAKIIRLDTDKMKNLLDDIIIASNNQNPMNERNLRSNTMEQKRIQASFYSEPLQIHYRYYYIRKDGEFEAFLANKNRHPRKQWFEIPGSNKRGKNRYRHIDNEQLAKIWWAWIGNGSAANTGGVKFFSDGVYPKVFIKRPSEQFWEAFCNHRFVFNAELLSEESPSPYQFLLAMAISSFISARVKPEGGTAGLKRRTIQKLMESGELPRNADQNQIASALDKDRTYLNESWKSMMTFALTEIASFILTKKYGNLDPDVCKKLISR